MLASFSGRNFGLHLQTVSRLFKAIISLTTRSFINLNMSISPQAWGNIDIKRCVAVPCERSYKIAMVCFCKLLLIFLVSH